MQIQSFKAVLILLNSSHNVVTTVSCNDDVTYEFGVYAGDVKDGEIKLNC